MTNGEPPGTGFRQQPTKPTHIVKNRGPMNTTTLLIIIILLVLLFGGFGYSRRGRR